MVLGSTVVEVIGRGYRHLAVIGQRAQIDHEVFSQDRDVADPHGLSGELASPRGSSDVGRRRDRGRDEERGQGDACATDAGEIRAAGTASQVRVAIRGG